jgi:hypothetical protein
MGMAERRPSDNDVKVALIHQVFSCFKWLMACLVIAFLGWQAIRAVVEMADDSGKPPSNAAKATDPDEARRQRGMAIAAVTRITDPGQETVKQAVEITPEKQHEFASVAQAEGVSLSVARRLLQVVEGSKATPSVPALGRATRQAGERAGRLLVVLDEGARPMVEQATADEIFLAEGRS